MKFKTSTTTDCLLFKTFNFFKFKDLEKLAILENSEFNLATLTYIDISLK